MGFVTTGTATPHVIKGLIKDVFGDAKNQKGVDAATPAFQQRLTSLGLRMRDSAKNKPGHIVWHKDLGVVVDGYTFESAAPKQP